LNGSQYARVEPSEVAGESESVVALWDAVFGPPSAATVAG
jgi:hypothetical protein